MFDNKRDAEMRINKSVVMYKKRPVYITGISEKLYCTAHELGDPGAEHRFKVTSRLLDLKPVKTGYLNLERNTVYLVRTPVRRWKQGLNAENIRIHADVAGGARLLDTVSMRNCILNAYPKYPEAIASIREGWRSIAFHRHYAMSAGPAGLVFLLYRGDKVGWIKDDSPVISDEYRFIEEELQEVIG
jgi:hypothetical protein